MLTDERSTAVAQQSACAADISLGRVMVCVVSRGLTKRHRQTERIGAWLLVCAAVLCIPVGFITRYSNKTTTRTKSSYRYVQLYSIRRTTLLLLLYEVVYYLQSANTTAYRVFTASSYERTIRYEYTAVFVFGSAG